MATNGYNIPHDVLEGYRFAAIALRRRGVAVSVIAQSFGVHSGSVYRWLSTNMQKGSSGLESTKAKGPPPAISFAQYQQLMGWLRLPASMLGYATDLWSGPRVRHLLKERLKIEYHPKHMPRLLRRLGLVLKFPERRALEQDSEEVAIWMEKRLPEIIENARNRRAFLYYSDESLISLIPYVGRTWTFPEAHPTVQVSGKRGQHVGVTGAVNKAGRIYFELTADGERFTSKVFLRFVRKLRKQHPNRSITLIVDGAPIHKSKRVKSFLKDNRWLRIEILPAYSPELNPTEKVWGHVKCKARNGSQARDKAELRNETRIALRKLKKDRKKIASFFNDVQSP